jgi:hypothetical protein
MTVALTGYLLFWGILTACVTDVCLECFLGNEYTFSWNLLGMESTHPLFGMAIVYTLMTLSGHLTLPHFGPPPGVFLQWVKIVLGLLPILIAVGFIGLHPAGSAQATVILENWLRPNELWFGVVQGATALLGLANGHYNVPQHVY